MGERIKAIRKKKACNILSNIKMGNWEKLLELISLSENKDRSKIEEREDFLQIIPYCVLQVDANKIKNSKSSYPDYKYLVYRRAGSEKRLEGKWSIGAGGHWKSRESFYDCLCRELKEEFGVKLNVEKLLLCMEGFIKLHDTPVDRVHLGVVFLFEDDDIDLDNFHINNEIEKYELVNEKELEKYKLETWSEYVVNNYL